MREPSVRLIGDGHGNLTPVRQAVREGRTVVHLGDFGFAATWRKGARLPNVFVIAGNHDEVPVARISAIFLGDFGDLGSRIEGAEGTFFIRGAASVDREERTEGKDWWTDEELDSDTMEEALATYLALRPHTVLSHEAPMSVVREIHGEGAVPSRTSELLEQMLTAHQPGRWFFGHHHLRWNKWIRGTSFRCLGIDESLDIELGIPERERWLWRTPKALEAVMRGLEESANGEVEELGSFLHYMEEDPL